MTWTWPPDHVYVIAECGSNWFSEGDTLDVMCARAFAMIDTVADAGADCAKFQVFSTDSVYAQGAGSADYLGDQRDIRSILRDVELPREWIEPLAEKCRARKVDFMASIFSEEDFWAVDPFVSVHKIASYEITHWPLIELVARSGKPLILSTGAADEREIKLAVLRWMGAGGKRQDLCLMKCTAAYPAPLNGLNLRALPALAWPDHLCGLSDHSADPALAPVMAVAMGANVIEKHFTMDRTLRGPDHSFAVEPGELRQMVGSIRLAESALGDGTPGPTAAEQELRRFAQRRLQATQEIRFGGIVHTGDIIHARNVAMLRPGKQSPGAGPWDLPHIVGRRARRTIQAGEGVTCEDVQ